MRNTIIVAGILSVLYLILLFSQKIRRKTEIKRVLLRRLKRGVFGVVKITLFCMVCGVVLPLEYEIITNKVGTQNGVQKEQSHVEQYTMANNMDMILKLQEKEWEVLNLKERLEVCQMISNIESNYLGLPAELEVVSKELTGTEQAHYWDLDRKIVMNEEELLTLSVYETVNAVCHETRHLFQHRLVDAYNEEEESLGEVSKNLSLFEIISGFD